VGVCALGTPADETMAANDRVAIAPVHEALTFARMESDSGPRSLLVLRYERGLVDAIDLSKALGKPVRDPVDVFEQHGRAQIEAIASRPPRDARVSIPSTDLTVPLDLGTHHVAAGTNYPEHAGEAGVEDGPFLFPKLVMPTGPRANVTVGKALLDHEVELAWVTLDDVHEGSTPEEMGILLCNDYTDRDTLLRQIDVSNIASGEGFTTGKSFPGYLPVGDLFVVPRDYRAFAASRELVLEVNGVLRQRSMVSAQIWDIDELIAEIWKRRDRRWLHRAREVGLLADGNVLPRRTMILSGTPSGTVFRDIGLAHKAKGVAAWILGGWREPITKQVIDAYTHDPNVRALYLRPGDRVTARVDGLGVIDNEIIP